jgi:hypothetical protein
VQAWGFFMGISQVLQGQINEKPPKMEGFLLQTNERKKTNFSYAELKTTDLEFL